jgi:hypothetical protein
MIGGSHSPEGGGGGIIKTIFNKEGAFSTARR